MRIITVIIIIVFTSCTEQKSRVEEEKNATLDTSGSTIVQADSIKTDSIERSKGSDNFLKLDEFKVFKRLVQPVSFSENSLIYKPPDTSSQVLDTLKFNTSLTPVLDIPMEDWITIQYNGHNAYIRLNDVALYSFNSQSKNIKYFISGSAIYKYNFTHQVFLDTFQLTGYFPEYVRQFNSLKWKNVDIILLFETYGQCCGCSDRNIYIIDANGKFDILFSTSQYFSDLEGEDYSSFVTLPLDPQRDTIFYSEYESGQLFDKNNNPLYEPNGEFKMGVLKDIKKLYKWDGFKLEELP
jgi:hypothetical protein